MITFAAAAAVVLWDGLSEEVLPLAAAIAVAAAALLTAGFLAGTGRIRPAWIVGTVVGVLVLALWVLAETHLLPAEADDAAAMPDLPDTLSLFTGMFLTAVGTALLPRGVHRANPRS